MEQGIVPEANYPKLALRARSNQGHASYSRGFFFRRPNYSKDFGFHGSFPSKDGFTGSSTP